MLKNKLTVIFLLWCQLLAAPVLAQTVAQKLSASLKTFHADSQLQHAVTSLYVLDAKSGKVVYEHNGRMGLVPASTLKVITGISAYELLGKEFRYETRFTWQQKQEGTSLLILPSGDPTFGSWRWGATGESAVLGNLVKALKSTGTTTVSEIMLSSSGWGSSTLPDGWLWQDIGNYYGAGAAAFNWRENQYDVFLQSGKRLGDPVTIIRTVPALEGYTLRSEVTAGAAGSGDSAYIYFPLHGTTGTIRGTIPLNRESFKISGAMPDPTAQFAAALHSALAGTGIRSAAAAVVAGADQKSSLSYPVFHTVSSPPLDSMLFWFNRKSVNLYGEALVKSIGLKHRGKGATDKGVAAIKSFWTSKGISAGELNMVDGSGLSPVNRVTTHALVLSLHHARQQTWYSSFYHTLPTLNGLKMKSGTMRGVKGFAGYHRDKAGNEYVFAFLVNNYAGTSSNITRKMYRVLDNLK